MSFIIFSLPRSRSKWISHFLSYQGAVCGHDTAASCGSVEQFLAKFGQKDFVGTCETGAVLGWKLIRHCMPKAKLIVVRRPVDQIIRSLAQQQVWVDPGEMQVRGAMLDALSRAPGVKTITYEQLEQLEVCKWLFEHCLDLAFDFEHWQSLASTNIQIDMRQRMELLSRNALAIAAFKKEVLSATASLTGGALCPGLN